MAKLYDQELAGMVQSVSNAISKGWIKLDPIEYKKHSSLQPGYYLEISVRDNITGVFIIEEGTEIQVAALEYSKGSTKAKVQILHSAKNRLVHDRKYISGEINNIRQELSRIVLGAEYRRKPSRRSLIVNQGAAIGEYEVTFRDLGSTMAVVKLESNGGKLHSAITFIR